MKRVTVVSMIFAVFTLSAQKSTTGPAFATETFTDAEIESLNTCLQNKKAGQEVASRKKTQGTVSQRMSHSDVAALLYGSLLRPVFTPFAPDSNYMQLLKGLNHVNVHGFGQTFDPASKGFELLGQSYFSENDPYTIDTIYVGVRYRTAAPVTGLTGDTLRVVFFTGETTNNAVWRIGIGYDPNTFPNQTSRIDVLAPRYAGNPAIGVQGKIKAPNKIVFNYALKDIDTTLNYIKIVPPAPIQVAAGEKVGVFCNFIPGYTYDAATQLYYVSGGKGDVNNISWLYYTAQSSTDVTPYFLESYQFGFPSQGISNQLLSETRYGSWTGSEAFRNEYVAPSTITGNFIDFWVTGSTTVGIDEPRLRGELEVYPNPTNGKANIVVPQGGRYTLLLMTTTGQFIHSETVDLNGERQIQRDFSELPGGVYIFLLQGDSQSHTARISIN